MDKSRSRYRLRELIIEDKTAVTLPRKFTEFSFGFLFWGIWGFLWLPLISTIAWLLGIRFLSYRIWKAEDYDFQVMIILFAIIALIAAFNWSLYNSYRQPSSLSRAEMTYYWSKSTPTSEFFEFDGQEANQLMESDMLRFGFQKTQEIPSFVLIIDEKSIIKKKRKLSKNDK